MQKRSIRVIYAEHDHALRSLVSKQIQASTSLILSFTGPDFQSVMNYAQKGAFDVCLLDLVLGQDRRSGLELALALRSANENCGVVIYSNQASSKLIERLPPDQRYSFSVLEKRDPVDFELIVSTLVNTALGYSSIDESIVDIPEHAASLLMSSFTLRDHQIMRMLCSGKTSEQIAKELHLASVTVRQDLSRIYLVLVPDRTEGLHLRTMAITAYLAALANERFGPGGGGTI